MSVVPRVPRVFFQLMAGDLPTLGSANGTVSYSKRVARFLVPYKEPPCCAPYWPHQFALPPVM